MTMPWPVHAEVGRVVGWADYARVSMIKRPLVTVLTYKAGDRNVLPTDGALLRRLRQEQGHPTRYGGGHGGSVFEVYLGRVMICSSDAAMPAKSGQVALML
jgi:hypothetical protein